MTHPDDLTAALPDAVRAFLAEAARAPLLTGAEVAALSERIRAGDLAARNTLIQHNIRLVVSVAKRYPAPAGLDIGDVIGWGCQGLIKAAERFDPSRGNQFSTHAHWWIRQAISRALSDYGEAIRKPVHAHGKQQRLRRARGRLTDELGRAPTEAELAAETGIPVRWVRAITAAALGPVASLDAPLRAPHDIEHPPTIGDLLTAAVGTLERHERRVDQRAALDVIIARAHLLPREGAVIGLRFGLASDHIPRTLDECGARLKITRERVRQIETTALTKLRLAARRTGIPAGDVVDVA